MPTPSPHAKCRRPSAYEDCFIHSFIHSFIHTTEVSEGVSSCVMEAKKLPTSILAVRRVNTALSCETGVHFREGTQRVFACELHMMVVYTKTHISTTYGFTAIKLVSGASGLVLVLRAASGTLIGVLWDLSGLPGSCLGLSWAVLGCLGAVLGLLEVAKQPRADPELGSLRNL